MALGYDAATAASEYSIAGRRAELNGKPYAGLPEITGGGITIEGQNYVRGADGSILFVSRGIKTPQDVTSKMTLGAFKVFKLDLQTEAVALGLTQDEAWMDVPITIVDQITSGNPLALPYTETMIVSVMSAVPEKNSDGSGMLMAVTFKQHTLPTMG